VEAESPSMNAEPIALIVPPKQPGSHRFDTAALPDRRRHKPAVNERALCLIESRGWRRRMDCSGEHGELRRMMDDFAELMASSRGGGSAALPRARLLFSRRFASHMAEEAEHLRVLVASPAGSRLLPIFREYEDRVRHLRADYSVHVQKWTPQNIDQHWPDYVSAVLVLQDKFRCLMDWEESALVL